MPADPHHLPPHHLTDWLQWSEEFCGVCGKLIAAEKRADAALHRLRVMLDNAPWGVMAVGEQLEIKWTNRYILERIHCKPRDITGVSLYSLMPDEGYESRVKLFEKESNSEGVLRSGFKIYLRDCLDDHRFVEFDIHVLPELRDPEMQAFIIYMQATAQ